MIPQSGGPCLALPPFSMVWHWAHLALKSFAPALMLPSGTAISGSATTIAGVGDLGKPNGLEQMR